MELEEKAFQTSDKGTYQSTVWNFNDIKMGHAISKFKTLTGTPASNNNDVVRMHFGLKGDYSFTYKQLNKCFDLIGGHHNIMYSNGFDMVVKNKTLELEIFGVQFPKELFIGFTENASDSLKRFSENIINGKNVILTDTWGSIDISIQQVIRQIINCKFAGELKRHFLFSKSIELLVLSADGCEISENKKELFIKSKADKEKLIEVRDLVNSRIHCPPNLSEIAKIVGLNEYKLKRGFKETFNSTIFEYLTKQRLQLGYQYLFDTQKSVNEISEELGYATPQHFNNVFKKRFGITPNSVRKNP